MINDLCQGKHDKEIETTGLDEDLAGYLFVFKQAVCKDDKKKRNSLLKKRKAADALGP